MPPWGHQGHGTPFCAKPHKRFPCPLAQTGQSRSFHLLLPLSHLADRTGQDRWPWGQGRFVPCLVLRSGFAVQGSCSQPDSCSWTVLDKSLWPGYILPPSCIGTPFPGAGEPQAQVRQRFILIRLCMRKSNYRLIRNLNYTSCDS